MNLTHSIVKIGHMLLFVLFYSASNGNVRCIFLQTEFLVNFQLKRGVKMEEALSVFELSCVIDSLEVIIVCLQLVKLHFAFIWLKRHCS